MFHLFFPYLGIPDEELPHDILAYPERCRDEAGSKATFIRNNNCWHWKSPDDRSLWEATSKVLQRCMKETRQLENLLNLMVK